MQEEIQINFLIELSELLNELNQAKGYDAVVVFTKVLLRCKKHTKELNNLHIPDKDKVSSEGYKIANNAEYNYRRVLKDHEHDIYYSGWMDCFDWISKNK